MRAHAIARAAIALFTLMAVAGSQPAAGPQVAARGTISGHVKLTGKPSGNHLIRMGMDPLCAKANDGKRVVDEIVAVGADGGLANVFVRLQGTFPTMPVPKEPVLIDQRGCLYVPRVVGARVGQTLQIGNSDDLLHNMHSQSTLGNAFNLSAPRAGVAQSITLKSEEIMLRIGCDVHRWMTTYVGVVSHPFFAVTSDTGTFHIANVPDGSYSIVTWHERYGPLTRAVRVRAGTTTTVDLSYTGSEQPPKR